MYVQWSHPPDALSLQLGGRLAWSRRCIGRRRRVLLADRCQCSDLYPSFEMLSPSPSRPALSRCDGREPSRHRGRPRLSQTCWASLLTGRAFNGAMRLGGRIERQTIAAYALFDDVRVEDLIGSRWCCQDSGQT